MARPLANPSVSYQQVETPDTRNIDHAFDLLFELFIKPFTRPITWKTFDGFVEPFTIRERI